ncbi:hypothetical protein RD792_014475 [Penstemon davidsonii]|uniref:hAT-like transposase RNase-H fold domain-containing protein n=1 Tax=Penstemon davidsonii TaxID=160366 RepID=A0ABR0CPE7_9LAMI|nr:hypothetical protein RD792_014475 [Penstemon davidsonii]
MQSLARLSKFEAFQVEERIESKKSLCLDVPTRWNSVYLMLETALIFQRVFEMYELCDAELRADFRATGTYGRIGLPNRDEWLVVEKMVKILQHFYDLTLQISGSLYVTSNTFLDEISDVDEVIKDWMNYDDIQLREIAERMKLKFDKYWGDNEKMNLILYVAVMLDPRNKFSYVNHVMKNMYGNDERSKIDGLAKDALIELFNEYKMYMPDVSVSSSSNGGGSSTSTLMGETETNAAERERHNKRAARKQYQRMLSEIGMNDQNNWKNILSSK